MRNRPSAARRIRFSLSVFSLAIASAASAQTTSQGTTQAASQGNPPENPVFKVQVIDSTPLAGLGLTLDQIPAPVQTAVAADIQASGALDLSDFLNRRMRGVFVNEMQGNPFQPDLNYRGYTASPLLGTPQGLSVYMDGVRLNQPFGDVVSWDVMPKLAISSMVLMPGSNPLFGLNTLGGALSVQTKDGRTSPGTTIQATYGSHARRAVEFEHGGSNAAGLNWYVAGSLFAEDGWREDSPSDVRQLFGKLGWHVARSDVGLTVSYADNSLTGNGLQEQRFLANDYASVFTIPDQTANKSTFVNLTLRHDYSKTLSLSANAYFRDIRAKTFNADVNEDSLDESLYQLSAADIRALTAAGYSGFPVTGANASNTPFPYWRCIAQALEKDEPDEKCNGLLTNTDTVQQNYGASGQVTWLSTPGGHSSQLTAGGAIDGSRVDYQQSSQFGYLNPDRTVTPVDAYADGSTTVDGEPFDTRVNLHGVPQTWGVYATDTFAPGEPWRITLSARYNRTTIDNADRLAPAAGPGSLTGRYVFGRLNPAAGVTFQPTRTLNFYAGYSEGSRAPTSIELGCADPSQPCKLPNALAGDPPLAQVVTRTWEAGIRSGPESRIDWTVSAFRAANDHDILFVASEQTGFGYFKNFDQTRREGIEMGASERLGRLTVSAGYTYLRATYESAETFDGSSNSTNGAALDGAMGLEGAIEVRPGDRIPLIPAHTLKFVADVRATSKLSLDLDVVAASGAYARGNENNAHEPDGLYYLGPGTTPAYAVANLSGEYRLAKWLRLVGQVNNVFDSRYYTAAQLLPTGFTNAGTFIARPFPAVNGEFPIQNATFYAPGAPTTFWVGTRLVF